MRVTLMELKFPLLPHVLPAILTAEQLQTSLSFLSRTSYHNKSLIKEQDKTQAGHKEGQEKGKGRGQKR